MLWNGLVCVNILHELKLHRVPRWVDHSSSLNELVCLCKEHFPHINFGVDGCALEVCCCLFCCTAIQKLLTLMSIFLKVGIKNCVNDIRYLQKSKDEKRSILKLVDVNKLDVSLELDVVGLCYCLITFSCYWTRCLVLKFLMLLNSMSC